MKLAKKFDFFESLNTFIKIQNLQLIKLIANNENWDFKELIKYIK